MATTMQDLTPADPQHGTTASRHLSRTDLEWGYEFGCDGVMGLQAAAEFLGKSEETVRLLMQAGALRKGKPDAQQARWVVCRRSILNHLKTIER